MDAPPTDAVRVAFDTGPLHGARTGIGHAVAALHAALHQRDDVDLTDYLVSFRADPGPGARRLPIPAAVAHRCWARSDLPRADRWLAGVQLVHGTNYVVPPTRAPQLVSVYDCWFLRNPGQAVGAVRRSGQVLRRSIERGATVVTSSHATTAAVRDLFPGVRAHTVHLGALALPAAPATAPVAELKGRPYVLAVGTIERRKNLPTLVRAFGAVATANPDLLLVLAGGDGDDRDAGDAAVDALGPGLAPRVLFAGRVDDDARAWLVRNAAVLAYPSLDEGFGFPLLDAMQAGVPVVASDAGSIPEVAGDAALLCAAHDGDNLAANLSAALTDSEVRARLVNAGDQQWRRFTWTKCADDTVALYRQLAGEGR